MKSSRIVHGIRSRKRTAPMLALFMAAFAWALLALEAHAVPSFARQTHQPCTSCHIGGFGSSGCITHPANVHGRIG